MTNKVKALQQILADAGFYTGTIDGLWGPKSEAAKVAWEQANNQKFHMDNFTVSDSIGDVPLYYYGTDKEKALVTYTGATIDADGAPHAYHPTDNSKALDYLAAAGHPGNWWGVVTQNGKFVLQGANDPAPGFCISTTALKVKHSSSLITQQVNAEEVPFIVLPSHTPFAKLGDYGTLWYAQANTIVHVLFADIGPRTHWGEISYKSALDLKIPDSSPKHGGLSRGLFYIVYPGTSNADNGLIDSSLLTKESIDFNANSYWQQLDKNAILTFYGILDFNIQIPK